MVVGVAALSGCSGRTARDAEPGGAEGPATGGGTVSGTGGSSGGAVGGNGALPAATAGQGGDTLLGGGTGGRASTGGSGAAPRSTGGVGTGGAAGSGGVSPVGGASTGGTGATPPGGAGAAAVAGTSGIENQAGGTGGESTRSGGTGGQTTETGGAPAQPVVVTSGEDSGCWREGELVEVPAATAVELDIDPAQILQEWWGFGGTFSEAGGDALRMLSAADREWAMRLLFDPFEGAGLVFGRVPIGASDYALDRYTLAEQPDDYMMESFSIERDEQALIPFVQAALRQQPGLHLWACPWTPPPWMKDNGDYDGGSMRGDASILQAHALYLTRFVEAYADAGVPIEVVMPQNEPGYSKAYPSCEWSASVLTTYIADHLGPLFAERLPHTDIWLGALSSPNSTVVVDSVMNDEVAAGYISGFGFQEAMGDAAEQCSLQYGLPIVQTLQVVAKYISWEAQPYTPVSDWSYAEEMWKYITNWIDLGVNAYFAENLVLDAGHLNLDHERPTMQQALLVVDQSWRLNLTPAYYVLRHLSAFVDPGARLLRTTGNVDALAFLNPDGSIVTVVHNEQGRQRELVLGIGSTHRQVTLPSNGWTTVDWPSRGAVP